MIVRDNQLQMDKLNKIYNLIDEVGELDKFLKMIENNTKYDPRHVICKIRKFLVEEFEDTAADMAENFAKRCDV